MVFIIHYKSRLYKVHLENQTSVPVNIFKVTPPIVRLVLLAVYMLL